MNLFRISPDDLYTWAFKGSQNVIVNIKGNSKDGFTYLVTISADRKAFPIKLILKGSTTLKKSNWFGSGHYISAPNNMDEVSVENWLILILFF